MEVLLLKFKIRRPAYSVLNFEKSLTVGTFLGGLTIGVLTFLFQVDEGNLQNTELPFSLTPADYKKILIFVAGISATLLILSVFAIKVVIVDKRKGNELFSITSLYTYEAGFIALVLLLPFLVYPFLPQGAFIIWMIEAAWGVIFLVYKRSNSKNTLDKFFK
jgi:hypothetical protein